MNRTRCCLNASGREDRGRRPNIAQGRTKREEDRMKVESNINKVNNVSQRAMPH